MTETRACPQCGAAAPPGIKFCGSCGFKMPEQPAPAGPAAKPASPKRTMVGMPAVTGPGAGKEGGTPSAPSAPSTSDDAFASTPAEGVSRPSELEGSTEPASPKPARKPAAGRTMLGMPAVQAKPGATPPAQAPSEPQPSPSEPAPPAQGARPAPSAGPSQGAGAASPPAGPTKRTMLGMAGVASQGLPGPAPAGPSAPAGAGPAQQPGPPGASPAAPVPGGAPPQAPGAGPDQAPPPHAPPPARFSAPSGSGETEDLDVVRPRRTGLFVLLGVGAAALVALVAGLVVLFASGSGPEVRAKVVGGDHGEVLQVDVPGATEGSKVRFAGQEKALEAGRARFPLAADALSVGDNELDLDIVHPDGEVEQAVITLTLDYRVFADLDGLDDSPPSIALVVRAPPGTRVTLQEEPLALDADGRGRRKVRVDEVEPGAGPDAVFEHEATYRIEVPDGEPASGTLHTRIPYTTLRLDRPGREVLTDEESIEIAGAVHPSATVTIDGDPVDIDEGRFLVRHPLPEPGVYEPTLVAHQPGRVPRGRTIRLERVADLEEAAAAFDAERDLSYPKILQNPSIYRGRKVDLTGRVYNVEVGGGKSVLQMLVGDCPRSERCPLWVSYDAATDITVQDWARVLGEVAGEQQFRAESGRVISVPRVHAKLVLPVKQ